MVTIFCLINDIISGFNAHVLMLLIYHQFCFWNYYFFRRISALSPQISLLIWGGSRTWNLHLSYTLNTNCQTLIHVCIACIACIVCFVWIACIVCITCMYGRVFITLFAVMRGISQPVDPSRKRMNYISIINFINMYRNIINFIHIFSYYDHQYIHAITATTNATLIIAHL